MKRAILAIAALVALTACTPAQTRAWLNWHADDPTAAIAFLDTPEGQAMLTTTDAPQFAQWLEGRGGCDGIYDEMRRQGATHPVASRFAYVIAPRESGCTPQYVHDRDDWSHSRFGLNGLTAGLRANWAQWCGADVRTDTANLTTDVRCALAAYHRMSWRPWS
jgi:hypothetical protein